LHGCMYINLITGINLGSSVVLFVNSSDINLFLSWAPALSASRHCSVLFHLLSAWLTQLHGIVQYHFHYHFRLLTLNLTSSLSQSSWATSVPVHSCFWLFSFMLSLLKDFIKAKRAEPQKTHENQFSLVLVVAAILHHLLPLPSP